MSGTKGLAEYTGKQLQFIDYCASGNSILEDDVLVRVSQDEMAKRLGVSRVTLHNWKSKAGFWDVVDQRRNSVIANDWAPNIYKAMYREALKGNVQAAKLLLNQADILKADHGQGEPGNIDNSITVINYAQSLPDEVKRKVIEGEAVGIPTTRGTDRQGPIAPLPT